MYKHFLGGIPPAIVIMVASAVAYAQGTNIAQAAPISADMTTILTGVGTGGLTIWFCLKWVSSELERVKEFKEAQNEKLRDELAKIHSEWNKRYEELMATKDNEKELRIQVEKDYADRLRDMLSSIQVNNQMLVESVRTLAQIDRDKRSGNQT